MGFHLVDDLLELALEDRHVRSVRGDDLLREGDRGARSFDRYDFRARLGRENRKDSRAAPDLENLLIIIRR